MPSNYQPGIPTGSVPLNQDYLNIQGNFQQLDTSFGVDHVAFSNGTNNGYHTDIHLVPVSVFPPPTTSAAGQLYCNTVNDGVNNDTALYFLTAGGRNIKLTENFSPVTGGNGYTFLPGGLILQWGVVNGTHGGFLNGGDTGTVTFATSNIAFPNNCFSVWTQLQFTNGSPPSSTNTGTVGVASNFTKTAFNWACTTNSGSYTKFFWVALGN